MSYTRQYAKIKAKITELRKLFVNAKIHLPKVEHPKFEGHLTLNEEE